MENKNYQKFTVAELAADDQFIDWCLEADEEAMAFWEDWINKNPAKQTEVSAARRLVLGVQEAQKEGVNEVVKKEVWDSLSAHIETDLTDKQVKKETKHSATFFTLRRVGSIAAGLLIAVLAISLLYQKDTAIPSVDNWVMYENSGSASDTIRLADASMIVLKPNSQVRYRSDFLGEKREVILHGEAFFDVARDTTRPFMVYANETITKVLGTSFLIQAFNDQKEVAVDVKSGKVEVYAAEGTTQKSGEVIDLSGHKIAIPKPNRKIALTANQKGVFNVKKRFLNKKITDTPELLVPVSQLTQYVFKNESVVNVFKVMKKAYGIDIQYDESVLRDCTISTKINQESLWVKMAMIVEALGLEMEEKDAVIFIQGKGC